MPALDPDDDEQPFPPIETATDVPNGLLAVGGSLRSARLFNAYRHGVFPWFEDGQPILWWTPTPRMVLKPDGIHVSRSLRKLLKQQRFHFSFDRSFQSVIEACAQPRSSSDGTWITRSMQLAYTRFHEAGHAHSFEVWQQQELVGGLYGVAIGRMFFGESMFSRASNASKAGMVFMGACLKAWGYGLIDCQLETEHLSRMGAYSISRREFKAWLERLCDQAPEASAWQSAPAFYGANA